MLIFQNRARSALLILPALVLLAGTAVPATAQGLPREPGAVQEVREALARDPIIPSNRIVVSGSGGLVTLEGDVEDSHVRDRAARIARGFAGVLGVDNNIVVQPSFTTARRQSNRR